MQTPSRIPWCKGVANARGGLHNPSYFGQLPYQNKSPNGKVMEKEERDGHFSTGEAARTVPWFINNHHGNLVKWASLFIFFRWGIWDSESGCSGLPAVPPPLPKEDITTKYNKNWKTILPTTGYPTTVIQNLASSKVAMREVLSGWSLNTSLWFFPLYSWAEAAGHHSGFSFSFFQRISGLFKTRKFRKLGNKT